MSTCDDLDCLEEMTHCFLVHHIYFCKRKNVGSIGYEYEFYEQCVDSASSAMYQSNVIADTTREIYRFTTIFVIVVSVIALVFLLRGHAANF